MGMCRVVWARPMRYAHTARVRLANSLAGDHMGSPLQARYARRRALAIAAQYARDVTCYPTADIALPIEP